MKKIILIVMQILLITLIVNAKYYAEHIPGTGTIVKNDNYDDAIVGKWFGKTYKTIFNFPVYLTANFKKNKLFHLNIRVLAFNYDDVRGNYSFEKNNKYLRLVGWRDRSDSKKVMVFKVIQFKSGEIRLSLLANDKEIKNATKPIQFFLDKKFLKYIEP